MIRHQAISIAFNIFPKWTCLQRVDDNFRPFGIHKQGFMIFCTNGDAENLISLRICLFLKANIFSSFYCHDQGFTFTVGQSTVAAFLGRRGVRPCLTLTMKLTLNLILFPMIPGKSMPYAPRCLRRIPNILSPGRLRSDGPDRMSRCRIEWLPEGHAGSNRRLAATPYSQASWRPRGSVNSG